MIELAPVTDLRDLEHGIDELALEHPDFVPEETWDRIGVGLYRPYEVTKNGRHCGHLIVQRVPHPPCLFLVYLRGGGGLINREGKSVIQKLARDWGCVDDSGKPVVRFSSVRQNWGRVARRFGFEPGSTNYRLVD